MYAHLDYMEYVLCGNEKQKKSAQQTTALLFILCHTVNSDGGDMGN